MIRYIRDDAREFVAIRHGDYEFRYPKHPHECEYVEIAKTHPWEQGDIYTVRWVADEWQEDPAGAMGAIMGALGAIISLDEEKAKVLDRILDVEAA